MDNRVLSAAALAGGLLALAGCGGGGRPSAERMDAQLATVLRLENLGEGTDYEVQVGCRPTGDSGLDFRCVVYALQEGKLRNTWFEQVTCRETPQPTGPYRCVTLSGYVLE